MHLYPTKILPRSYYKLRIDITRIFSEIGDFWVVRRGNGPLSTVSYVFGGKTRLLRDAFGEKIVGYSMNIIGGAFNPVKHIKYRQITKGTNDWNGSPVFIFDYIHDYKYIKDGFPIFFRASLFQNLEVPYKKPVSKEEHKVLTSDAHKHKIIEDKFDIDGLVKVKGHTSLIHSPNCLNYWHIMLQTFPAHDDNKELSDEHKCRFGHCMSCNLF